MGGVRDEWENGGDITPFTPTLFHLPHNPALPGLRALGSYLLHHKTSWMLGMGRGSQWEEREEIGAIT